MKMPPRTSGPKITGLARNVLDALEELKGTEIKVLDVGHLTTVCDWMLICTGTSNRHVKSLADNVIAKAKEGGVRPLGAQGMEMGEWVLVDLGSVVVHVMQAQTRAFYQLEKLWDVQPAETPETASKPKKPRKAAARSKAAAPKRKPAAKSAARGRTKKR
jgi:ribosome-associated protein